MIYDAIKMAGYDEAAPAGNGSDTDGVAVKAAGLTYIGNEPSRTPSCFRPF